MTCKDEESYGSSPPCTNTREDAAAPWPCQDCLAGETHFTAVTELGALYTRGEGKREGWDSEEDEEEDV